MSKRMVAHAKVVKIKQRELWLPEKLDPPLFFFFELKSSLMMFSALLFMPLCGLYTFI